ncbi:MAG: DNA repair protein RecO [Negativicutes bacterium]|nr:DNA repair protein RecO [Negativicutes bacterium]
MEVRRTAILLSVRESGASDRIAVFFSKEQGKIRVFCPGSRRKLGKGGILQPFSILELQLDETREGFRLLEAQCVETYPEIVSDWERLAYGSILLETVEALWPEEESQIELFDFLCVVVETLRQRSPRITVAAALWKILEFAGFGIEFDCCVQCGTPLEEGRFSSSEGGIIDNCAGICVGTECPSSVLEVLKSLQNYPWNEKVQGVIRGKDLVIAEKVLLEYLTYQLEKPLKSLQFLQKMK